MPREFKNLVMTNIRRIAHSPREAECIARFLLMQVILVCVAHAAQKTWFAERTVHKDPGTNEVSDESASPPPTGTESDGPTLSDYPGIPRRALWDFLYGPGNMSPAVPVLATGMHLHC
jgi:hypothetical protein